jgi:hypothetical protein
MKPEDPAPKKYGMKPREFERLNPPGPAGKGAEHDVFAILQQNRSVEQRKGLGEVEIRETRSRRKRDYWLVLIGGNLLIVGLVALGRFNLISVLFGLAGVVILSLTITWIMWFVMDDY